MRVRLGALSILLLATACPEERRAGPSTVVPSCMAPICEAPCTCDDTFECSQGCTCDAECGACRLEGGPCRMPMVITDAGQVDTGINSPDPNPDAGPCEYPISQGLSMPCCLSHGIDACGAGLFCAAFDGRTQATCYAERSREDLAECSADNHCQSGGCHPSMAKCLSAPNRVCEVDVGCADSNGDRYGCDTRDGTPECTRISSETGGFCVEPTDCTSGDCIEHICLANTGDSCFNGDECVSGICDRNTCGCDPFNSATCPTGQHCNVNVSGSSCIDSGTRQAGQSCNENDRCAAMLICVDAGRGPTCHAMCRLPDHPCPSGPCAMLGENFGACI